MPKYINADEFETEVYRYMDITKFYSPELFIQMIVEMPAADVVEVVYCKDCKYFDVDGVRGRPVDGQEVRMCKKFYNYPFLANEYCSRGKRRESDDEH